MKHKGKKNAVDDPSAERERLLTPVARELVNIILNAELPIGNYLKHEFAKFDNVAKDVIQLMMDHDIRYVDKEFLFQLAMRNDAKTIVDKYVGKIEFKDHEGKDRAIILNRETVSSIVLQPFSLIQGMVISSLEKSFNRIIDKVLGKNVLDFTITDMDKVLKEDTLHKKTEMV